MNTKTTKIALAAAALTSLAFAIPARADETGYREISLQGHDLSNPAQVSRIKQRIHTAARSICQLREIDSLSNRSERQKCFNQTVYVAEAKLEARVAAFTSKNGPAVALDQPIKIVGAKR